MKPCFYSLFKRGQYCRRKVESDLERKEAERFAVAALAFTLQYDPDSAFRQHFLERICGLPKEIASQMPDIQVESHNWADLLITIRNYAVVIECKINAPLKAHQNPEKKTSFYEADTGYGEAFLKAFPTPHIRKHFVVLGCRQPLKIKGNIGLSCFQRHWSDVKMSPSSDMVTDLYDCLGALHVQEFRSMRTNDITLKQDAAILAKGHALLQDTFNDLGLERSEHDLDATLEPTWWCYGFEIRKSQMATSATVKRLERIVKPKDRSIAWFGFQGDEQNSEAAVWFYCATKESRDAIENRFKSKGMGDYSLHRHEEECPWHIFVVKNAKSQMGDKEWFLSVINQVI